LDDGNTGQTVAVIGFVGGGIVAALSVALLLTAPRTGGKRKAMVWSIPCAPARGGASCTIGGKF
jgi:hypothetical protein